MKKRVLVLSNSSSGLYNFRNELLRELCQMCEVVVVTPDSGHLDKLKEIGCRIHTIHVDRRGINPVTDFGLLVQYVRLLKKEKPDFVITYTIKPNIYGGMACRLLGISYSVNITGLGTALQKRGALRCLVTGMYKLALKQAKIVFFENCENQSVLIGKGSVRQEQCKLLNGAGINLERYYVAPYPRDLGPIRFLFIGRIMTEKGANELFEAMRRLRRDGVDCVLDVLGSYEEAYQAQIQADEADGWLRYHGYQTDVRPFIACSHCFVLPSWHEGMANTNLECAAMGRPLITSRIHGCMEAVLEGESGLLCEAKNVDSLYDTMSKFCSLSLEQREAMGLAGRRHMEAVFDKKCVVRETLRSLEELELSLA